MIQGVLIGVPIGVRAGVQADVQVVMGGGAICRMPLPEGAT